MNVKERKVKNTEVHTKICPILSTNENVVREMVNLINRAYTRHTWLFPVDRTNFEDFLKEQKNFDSFVLLSQSEKIVGVASVLIRDASELYFSNAAVDLEQQGNGLGAKLLNAIEELARRENISRITIVTVREIGNVDYYERKGYKVLTEETQLKGTWGSIASFTLATMEKII